MYTKDRRERKKERKKERDSKHPHHTKGSKIGG
jgi:hypothetical protein